MRIVVVGSGYVGLVSAAGFADFGNEVLCVDVDERKIDVLSRGEVPFYEPGLKDLVARNVRERRLRFSTSLTEAVAWGDVIFLCVGTPPRPDGSADLSQVFSAAKTVAKSMTGYRLVVQKSTVPVGTADKLRAWIKKHARRGAKFDVSSNPEFLREGSAVENFLRPDRIVIGADTAKAAEILREIHSPLFLIETPTVVVSVRAAELIKYASNAFLATKISFINEVANLCDAVGADVHDVARGMGLDRRIGSKFLHPGPGYGGSCFPKDTHAMRDFSRRAGVRLRVVEAAIDANDAQIQVAIRKVFAALPGRGNHTAAVLGLSYKPDTDDLRAAPSLEVIRALLRRGVKVRAYDPAVRADAKDLPKGMHFAQNAYDAVKGADVMVLVTEWNEFRRLDLKRVKRGMRKKAIVDLRNVYERAAVERLGFSYTAVGRPQ